MNKLFRKIIGVALGLTMAIGVGVAVASNVKEASPVHAAETSAYKMTTVQSNKNTAYATYYDNITIGAKTWKVPGNQNFSGYWRIGGKKDGNNTNISRYLQCKTAFSENITKVTLSHGGFSRAGISISGATLTIASDDAFSQNVQTSSITPSVAQSTDSSFSFENASGWGTGKYYKIDLTMTNTSTSNGGLDVKSIEFFYNASTPLTGITLSGTEVGGTSPNYTLSSIAKSDTTTNHTVSVGLTPNTATDQKVKVEHYDGDSVVDVYSSPVTCTSGTGSFNVRAKGTAVGTERLKIYGNTETSVVRYLSVTVYDNSVTNWTVSFDSDGGAAIADMIVEDGETFEFPSPGTKTHYSFDGWSSDGGNTLYDAGDESPAVGDDIEYTAYWTEDAKYTVTYSAASPASGSYPHNNNYGGTYTLLPFDSLNGITYDSNVYQFKNYTVGGVNKNPGDTFTLSAATTVTVNFEEKPLEYQITFGTADGTSGISSFSNTAYVIPSGVTLDNIQGNVYSNTSNKAASLRFGKSGATGSFDATITGNYFIVSVTCNLKYYGTDTTATFAVTPNGGSAISKSLTGDWADYTYDVSAAKANKVTLGTDVNGKRAYLSGFTITYAATKVLSNIALSGTYPTTFTKGDTFSHSGMVVTANYSDSTSATVTSSATWSSPNMSTTGAKTITVSYSDEYGSASQTYSITVSYANPTGIELSQYSKTLALLEEFDVADVEVTINPEATADQSEYEWVVYDADGLVEDDTYVFADGVFWATEPADAVVLRCQSTKSGCAATVYADVTVEITGNPIVTLFNASNLDKTNGSESVFTDAGDITYHVTTENFSGTVSYTWSSSDPSVISIDSDNGASCDFYVEGDEGSTRLSCRVTDTASHDVTVYIDVTVEAWSVTAVSWTVPTIDVFSGATLTTSDVSSWNVKYSTDSGKTDQTAPIEDITVKLGGSTISLPYTWQAADHDKTLCVEVGGTSSSTTTVAVTQTINAVYAPLPGEEKTSTLTFTAACGGSGTSDGGEKWTVTSDGAESTYDGTKGIHYGTGSAAVQYINLTSSDFTSGKITKVVVNASAASGVSATVAVNVGGSAFGGDPQSLSQTATEYTFNGEVDADEIEVIVTKSSSATKAIYCKSIAVTYSTESSEKENIANDPAHKAAQKAVVAFAKAFNAALDKSSSCTNLGSNSSGVWKEATDAWTAFNSDISSLSADEQAYAKNLIKYATAQYTKDTDDNYEYCLERAVATYEICVKQHGMTAFMSDVRSVSSSPRINPIFALNDVDNSVWIISAVALVGLTAIGGYFFYRKRKENF